MGKRPESENTMARFARSCCLHVASEVAPSASFIEPRHEKTYLRGFRPDKTQTRLLIDRDQLKA